MIFAYSVYENRLNPHKLLDFINEQPSSFLCKKKQSPLSQFTPDIYCRMRFQKTVTVFLFFFRELPHTHFSKVPLRRFATLRKPV